MLLGFDKKAPHDSWNDEFIASVRVEALKLLDEPILNLPFSEFLRYYETGSRVEYEQLYMKHRKMLYHFVAMALYEDDEKWIVAISDILAAICGEFAWTFPAHIPKGFTFSELYEHIDLFASETSQQLAETIYLLSDRLPTSVVDMVKYNLMKRIVEPYLRGGQDFPRNNWQAVCHGTVAMTLIELGLNDEFSRVKDRIIEGMNIFLDSYPDDGICLEGPVYWTYGFGYFVHACSMIREYTKGEIDLFKLEKVEKMAHFYEWAFVGDEYTVPFSDAGHILYLNPGLIGFLRREYGTALITRKAATKYGYDYRWRFADMIRNLFWKEEFATDSTIVTEKYFNGAQWYYNRKQNYTLVAKSGDNDEPHNHNDIGSYIIYSDGKYIVDDLGWPEYDMNYFNHEYRYKNYICASSFGHSVPIVNGKAQLPGADKKGIVHECENGVFSLDLSLSYGLEIGTVRRTITCKDSEVIISDAVSAGNSIVSRLALRIKPEVLDGVLYVGNSTVTPSSPCEIKVSEEVFETRYTIGIIDTDRFVSAYLVDFIPKDSSCEVELTIKI